MSQKSSFLFATRHAHSLYVWLMYHLHKSHMLPALMTRRVILPDLFQLYKATRICQFYSFRVTMASRRRPTQQPKHNELCSYVEMVGPAFDPSRILLRRLFFLNDDKSKYVSVGFYPAHNYQPLVEYGGTRFLPRMLTAGDVNIVTELLPGLLKAMCRNKYYQ